MADQTTVTPDAGEPGFFLIRLSENASKSQRELAAKALRVQTTIRANKEKPVFKEVLPELQSAAVEGLIGLNGDAPEPDAALKTVSRIEAELPNALEESFTAPTAGPDVVAGAFVVSLPSKSDPDADPRGLYIRMKSGVSVVPANQMVLKNATEDTLITLQVILPEVIGRSDFHTAQQQRRYKQYQTKLLSLAQVGLQSEPAFPEVASQALNTLRSEVVAREGGRVKNGHMRILGLWALGFVFAIVSSYAAINLLPWMPQFFVRCQNMLLMLAGCMVGTWLSFGARRVVLSFDDLGHLENDKMEPPIRLIFVGLFTLMLGLIFISDMVDVKFGSFSTDKLLEFRSHALLIGMLCGLSEQVLPSAVSRRAAQFIAGLEK